MRGYYAFYRPAFVCGLDGNIYNNGVGVYILATPHHQQNKTSDSHYNTGMS